MHTRRQTTCIRVRAQVCKRGGKLRASVYARMHGLHFKGKIKLLLKLLYCWCSYFHRFFVVIFAILMRGSNFYKKDFLRWWPSEVWPPFVPLKSVRRRCPFPRKWRLCCFFHHCCCCGCCSCRNRRERTAGSCRKRRLGNGSHSSKTEGFRRKDPRRECGYTQPEDHIK